MFLGMFRLADTWIFAEILIGFCICLCTSELNPNWAELPLEIFLKSRTRWLAVYWQVFYYHTPSYYSTDHIVLL